MSRWPGWTRHSARLGLSGPIVFTGDLLAMFASVTLATDGYCVVAGTGAGAIRIRGGEIDRVVDLAGWQLGDLGSGYWLGHEAAKAAVAEMEGRGPATALTPALLEALNIANTGERRPRAVDAAAALHRRRLRPCAPSSSPALHRWSSPTGPIAVAAALLEEAERYLLIDFTTAFDPAMPGPVVLGGGVMPHLTGVPCEDRRGRARGRAHARHPPRGGWRRRRDRPRACARSG